MPRHCRKWLWSTFINNVTIVGEVTLIPVQQDQTSPGNNRCVFTQGGGCRERKSLLIFTVIFNLSSVRCSILECSYPWEEGMDCLLETQCFRTHSYGDSFSGRNGSLTADGICSKHWREARPETVWESGQSFGKGDSCWSSIRYVQLSKLLELS